MKILVVEPEKVPYEMDISGTLASMQEVVGGDIEAVYPYDDLVAIVCNDEGKINGLPLNREIEGGDIIAGTFFICGVGEEDFTSLPPDLMAKYKERFGQTDEFRSVKGPLYEVVFHKVKIDPHPENTPSKHPKSRNGDAR